MTFNWNGKHSHKLAITLMEITMKYKKIIILISTAALSSCAIMPSGKVAYKLRIASIEENGDLSLYCYRMQSIQEALAIAQTSFRPGLKTTVLQAYVDNYNKVMNNLKHIDANSDITKIRHKGESYACWMPEMRRVMPLMTTEMQTHINPEYYPSMENERREKNKTGEIFYAHAKKETNRTLKLHDFLTIYRYNPEREGLNKDLQAAYDNASIHLILKIVDDMSIGGEYVFKERVIPGLRNYFKPQSLEAMKKTAQDKNYFPNFPLNLSFMSHYAFDYPDSPQKTGTNIVISLYVTDFENTAHQYSITVPEEKHGTVQQCYDVPTFSRDRKGKKVKTGKTQSRCVDSTYTYTEDFVQKGTSYTTYLTGKMTMSINGRTILRNDRIITSADDVQEAEKQMVRYIAYRIKEGIFSAN